MFSVSGALAQFENELRKERWEEGRQAAVSRCVKFRNSLLILLPHWVHCETCYRNQKQQECEITHPQLACLVFTNKQTNDDETGKPELVFDDEIPKFLHNYILLTKNQTQPTLSTAVFTGVKFRKAVGSKKSNEHFAQRILSLRHQTRSSRISKMRPMWTSATRKSQLRKPRTFQNLARSPCFQTLRKQRRISRRVRHGVFHQVTA